MLRNGQKVQIIGEAYITVDGKDVLSKVAGRITTIIKFEYTANNPAGSNEDYYSIACSDRCIARGCLRPLDDEPCEEEFLEEFKQLIKENSSESITT